MKTKSFAIAFISLAAAVALAQSHPDLPNPYKEVVNWAKLPEGMKFGQVISVQVDAHNNMWVFHRGDPPMLEFDPSGKLLTSWGSGMFVQPHGLFIDRDGNIWATDGRGKDGKGHQVFKFTPQGKILMTLGKAGVAGTTSDTFNAPSAVLVAPDGDIFVADGHGGNTNARVVKFAKDGTFIKAWGMKGSGPGEFDIPHAIAMDSKGRIFVADRNNNRIQIFDQEGNYLTEWKQWGRPSGIVIRKDDTMYVVDSESNTARNPGFKRGIRIGSAKDGKIVAMIPDKDPDPDTTKVLGVEGVGVDLKGGVYGADVGRMRLLKYVKQ
ncbi:MAG TPA: peptidyl-alpha-hydroxyglycine alpha-amidating lyase family protein [Bryobacteraceae bacterium]|nr:peptidyl-alpha-hydroxyglycine alpha-amidating lyase family protein [Bryobacteraceae bacterium]